MPSKFEKVWICSRWEIPKTWMYHWVVGQFSTKSVKHPILNETHCAWNLFNPCQILTVDGEYVQVSRKICFIKEYTFLRKLLILQKCIIRWWCMITQWMTVCWSVPWGSLTGLWSCVNFTDFRWLENSPVMQQQSISPVIVVHAGRTCTIFD